MSKLYTEEQLRKAIDFFIIDETNKDKILETLIPIELPSDEEIITYVVSTGYYGHCTQEYYEGIEEGAKWMRNKIKGDNNENI